MNQPADRIIAEMAGLKAQHALEKTFRHVEVGFDKNGFYMRDAERDGGVEDFHAGLPDEFALPFDPAAVASTMPGTSWDDQVAAMVAGPVYASEAQIQAVAEILIEAGALPRGVASHGKPISDFARRIVEAVLGAR